MRRPTRPGTKKADPSDVERPCGDVAKPLSGFTAHGRGEGMERRRLLGLLTGAAAGLAGCAGGGLPDAGTETPTEPRTPAAGSVANVDLPVPEKQFVRSAPP